MMARPRRYRDVGVSRLRRDRDIGVTVSRRDRDVQKMPRDRLETETVTTTLLMIDFDSSRARRITCPSCRNVTSRCVRPVSATK